MDNSVDLCDLLITNYPLIEKRLLSVSSVSVIREINCNVYQNFKLHELSPFHTFCLS